MIQLDAKDQGLISMLRADARTSIVDLARGLGVSRATVQNRLRRLEKDKVITGYTVLLGAEIEKPNARALMSIRVVWGQVYPLLILRVVWGQVYPLLILRNRVSRYAFGYFLGRHFLFFKSCRAERNIAIVNSSYALCVTILNRPYHCFHLMHNY